MKKTLYIVAAGAITALGHDTRRTIASLRSGFDCFKEIPFLGVSGKNLQVSPIEGYAEGLGDIFRYKALALKALRPCLDGLTQAERMQTTIFLGLPRPERPGVPDNLAATIQHEIASTIKVTVDTIQPVSLGRASVFWSLKKAQSLLIGGDFQNCIIGGVDSLVNGNSLKGLSEAGMLKEEWDGFIPGESAAFIRVTLKPGIGCWGRTAVAIAGVGIATETADGTAENPLVGVGVKAAFKAAMNDAKMSESEINLCINDVNGTRAAFEDEAFGRIRFFRSPREHIEIWHPASYFGETGAAVGAIELIWGSAALELGFWPVSGILASASDAELRTAVVIRNESLFEPVEHRPTICVGTGIPILHPELIKDTSISDEDPGLHLSDVDNLHSDLVMKNFDELSWLISMREYHHLESKDPWADIEGFEQRLVAQLDALAWSGTKAYSLASELLMSDEMEEVAAATMVLLSFPLGQKIRKLLMDAIAESEERCQAIASVLSHMPRENSEPLLISMASNGVSEQVVSAIKALTVAGWVNESTLLQHFDTEIPELVIPLVEAVGAAGLRQFWGKVSDLLEAYPNQFRDVDVFGALAICPQGMQVTDLKLQQLISKASVADALRCLRDGISFNKQLTRGASLTPDMIEGIGWSGEQEAKSLLLESLELADDNQRSSAANALYRIYGCAQYEEVEVSVSEDIGDELIEDTIEVKRLSQDRAVWEEALRDLSMQHNHLVRLRHGKPWTNQSSLQHLKRPETSYQERLVAAWEYAIVNHLPLPIHPLQFVQRQKEALTNLMHSGQ